MHSGLSDSAITNGDRGVLLCSNLGDSRFTLQG